MTEHTFRQGETTLANLAEIYFKDDKEGFRTWMVTPRKEFGNASGYAFLTENPSIGMVAIAGQMALTVGVKKPLEIAAP